MNFYSVGKYNLFKVIGVIKVKVITLQTAIEKMMATVIVTFLFVIVLVFIILIITIGVGNENAVENKNH